MVDGTETTEKYVFKASSETTYSDLIFTNSYENNNWTIEDLGYPNKTDTLPKIDLSGDYKRLE